MNRVIVAVLAFVPVFTGGQAALAGVRIETIRRDIKTQVVEGVPQVVLVQDGKVRVATSATGAMILKGNKIYVVDDKRKAYRELDREKMQSLMGQAAGMNAQMQERMKNLPPEQRAMVEKMMGAQGAGAAPDIYEAKETGRRDKVDGRACRVWEMLKNGKAYEEVCVVPFSELPGKEDFQKTFKNLAEAFEGLAGGMPNASREAKARGDINGYPVRVRRLEKGKPLGVETVLKSWTEESVPASAFVVPAGYQKRDMPNLGAP